MVNVTYDDAGNTVVTIAGEPSTFYQGDMAWMTAAAVFVMIMTPGLGFFYSGLLRRKNALSMLWVSFMIYCVVTFEWFFWGYSLTFSETGSSFIGDLRHFGLKGVNGLPSPGGDRIPDLLFAFYQVMFATITPCIAFGASAERGRLGPLMILVFCWTTIVYNPIAHWTWSPLGWIFTLGGLDYAGGGPVHMSSGWAALAYSLYIGKRRGYGTDRLAVRPSSVANIVLGTVFLYFGWFGFNGGSACNMSLRAIQSLHATNIAAASGGLTWMLLDYRIERKWSTIGMCSGIVAALVGITPAAGFVGSPASLAIGVITATACNFATKVKYWVQIDDALDVWALHGIGGGVGAALTGLFADSRVAGFDGITEITGGWINHNWVQLGYQIAGACAASGYSFVVTLILCFLVDHIPGCSLRASEETELLGIDVEQMGEVTYDFVHHRREVTDKYDSDPYTDKGSQGSGNAEEVAEKVVTPHHGRMAEFSEA